MIGSTTRMKRSFILFILLFVGIFLTKAQIGDKNKHIEIAELIKKEYNLNNHKALHQLLDADFQKQFSEKELGDFFKFNISDHYGEMQSMNVIDFEPTHYHFLVLCKNGKVDLNLSCNTVGKITGMQWLPHKEVVVENTRLKNETYLSDNPKKTDLDLKIDSIVKNYMSNGANCGLSIGIINGDQIIYYNYGEMKRGEKQAITNASIFEIGSVSKTFTGILLAQAVTDKKVSLNDDIRKYLPEEYKNLEYHGNPIQLVHLANHTSRIPRLPNDLEKQPNYDANNPYKNYDKKMVFNFLKTVVIDTFPGKKSEYSNMGMALLGIILEKVYDKPFEQLIREYIEMPFNMSSTGVVLNEEKNKSFANGYNSYGEATSHWDLGDLAAAGGIRSTCSDMVKYTKANMEEYTGALKLAHSTTYNDGRNNTALAWQIAIRKGKEMIWHNGGTYGFCSFCGFIKSKKLGVVVLSNSGNSVDFIALGILKLLQ